MAGDTYWDNTALLLHFDGSNGSTTFTDSSKYSRSVTASNNAQLSTTTPKYGTACGTFDGASDYLSIGTAAELLNSSVDFTIETWAKIASSSTVIIAQYFDTSIGSTAWTLGIYSTGEVFFTAQNDGGGLLFSPAFYSSSTLATGQWYHVAVTRQGSTFRIFINGVLQATRTSSTAIRPTTASAYALRIGGAFSGSWFNGQLDDLRITSGLARYTAAFTPPTEALPDGYPPSDLYAAAGTPLQSAAAVISQSLAFVSAGSPIQSAAATLALRNLFASSAGPLAPADVLAWHQVANAQASSPLQPAQTLAYSRWATLTAASPLQPAKVFANVPLRAIAAAGSPLQPGASLAWHDFSSGVVGTVSRYVMDLVVGSDLVRVPITSWQATLQTDDTCYVQCVVHDALTYADEIASATDFIISRTATTSDGLGIEYVMASSPLESRITDRGPTAYTATLSGYADAFTPSDSESSAGVRVLSYIRSVNNADGMLRARADIDWLLRPGMQAEVDGVTMDVSYINYYVTSAGDQYMDCGERA